MEHNLGSATEMIINITLVDDFVTFNILNCKNYVHLSIKLQLILEIRYTKIRYIGKVPVLKRATGPSFSDYESRRNKK